MSDHHGTSSIQTGRLVWQVSAIVLAMTALFGPTRADAASRQAIAALCDQAAETAALESGVPLDVLRSISLTETGRRSDRAFLPWPWTVNMEGSGKWFETYTEASQYVAKHMKRGARSFDVGCFQINYRWHGDAFTSVEQMFDPLENARYAARFLGELHQEFGDWSRAAGAFHSRTPELARKYAARFDRIRRNLLDAPSVPLHRMQIADAAIDNVRQISNSNRFPLLKSGLTPIGLASLVPSQEGSARRFLPVGQAVSILARR